MCATELLVIKNRAYSKLAAALTALGSYIYAGGEVTEKVYKYDPSNMSKVAESLGYGTKIKALTVSDYSVVGLENKSANMAAKLMAAGIL